jgi:hypothetical protein
MVDRYQDDRDGREPGTNGFRVEDRRSFDAGGDRRPGPGRDAPQEAAEGGPMPETTPFLRLVGGLAASAYVALGAFPPPGGGEDPQVDLAAAREVIDILGDLHEKTAGNLDSEEQNLLGSHLSELRLLFVQKSREG